MNQIDPALVQQFLDENPKQKPEELVTDSGDVVKTVDYDEIKAAKAESDKSIKETQDNVEAQRSKLFEPDLASITSLSPWMLDKDDLKVEVNAEDKSLYMKSLLNDTDLILEIKLDSGIKMKFKSLTNYDFDVVFAALKKETDAGNILGPSQYASKVQQAAAALQFLGLGENITEPVKFTKPYPSITVSSDKLLKYIKEDMAGWSWGKWQCIVTGLRIFETKLSICNENIRNGNFWVPADTV